MSMNAKYVPTTYRGAPMVLCGGGNWCVGTGLPDERFCEYWWTSKNGTCSLTVLICLSSLAISTINTSGSVYSIHTFTRDLAGIQVNWLGKNSAVWNLMFLMKVIKIGIPFTSMILAVIVTLLWSRKNSLGIACHCSIVPSTIMSLCLPLLDLERVGPENKLMC